MPTYWVSLTEDGWITQTAPALNYCNLTGQPIAAALAKLEDEGYVLTSIYATSNEFSAYPILTYLFDRGKEDLLPNLNEPEVLAGLGLSGGLNIFPNCSVCPPITRAICVFLTN